MLKRVCAIFLAIPWLTSAALADEAAPIDFSLDYRALADCPSESAFETALRGRLPAARRVDASEDVPRLFVRLPGEGTEPGEISATLPDGTSLRRQVVSADCADAMQSMAVIAAMALEAGRHPAAPAPLATSTPDQPKPAAATPAPVAQVLPGPPVELAPSVAVAPARWRWSVVAAGGIESASGPGVSPAFVLGVELASASQHVWSASVRLNGMFAQSTQQVETASARFRLWSGSLDLCPTRLQRSAWDATACAQLVAGQLQGSADNVAQPRPQNMPWLGAGLLVRGAVRLSGALALELSAGARGLLVHDRFIFDPAFPVHQVPVISADLLMGLRYTWS